jgi:hypothetical protein
MSLVHPRVEKRTTTKLTTSMLRMTTTDMVPLSSTSAHRLKVAKDRQRVEKGPHPNRANHILPTRKAHQSQGNLRIMVHQRAGKDHQANHRSQPLDMATMLAKAHQRAEKDHQASPRSQPLDMATMPATVHQRAEKDHQASPRSQPLDMATMLAKAHQRVEKDRPRVEKVEAIAAAQVSHRKHQANQARAAIHGNIMMAIVTNITEI